MSLRIFHIIFVILTVALSLFVAAWGLREYSATRSTSGLAMGVVFLACAGALAFYGVRVWRKLRDLP